MTELNRLAKKLKLDKATNAALANPPAGYADSLQPLPEGASLSAKLSSGHDWIQIFVKTQAEFEALLPKTLKAMAEQCTLWISFPKGSSGIQTDLTRDKGWEALSALDLRFVTLVAVDDTWSAIGLRSYKPGEERVPNPFLRG